jgi:hypothetical protein
MVNGIYWEPIYPRLLTTAQTSALLQRPTNKLLGIADISCDLDVRGGMQQRGTGRRVAHTHVCVSRGACR